MRNILRKRTRLNTSRLQKARKKLKIAVRNAKNNWIQLQCHNINTKYGTKQSWDTIKLFKKNLTKTKKSSLKHMKRPDGTSCSTPEENAQVFHSHFQTLFDKEAIYDESVLEELPQHHIHQHCDYRPTDEEIKIATRKLKNNAPGDSGIMPQLLKCLLHHQETFLLLKTVILQIWDSETVPEEWNIGHLIILPKKGDLSLPKNYRGIMLLEIAYKILAIILHSRLLPIVESLDHEPQCGFRPGRGCMDAIFTIKSAIKKRSEHGLHSWVLFLDLVKAFDRVPRDLLWKILTKFGIPKKLVDLLRALHSNFKVKFKVDDVISMIACIIGVKQEDILGPILFVFFIAAVMITWRATNNVTACIFYSKMILILQDVHIELEVKKYFYLIQNMLTTQLFFLII